jgi:pachytene checkpoint protein 2
VGIHHPTQLDQLADNNRQLLFVATSNYTGAIDDAFLSRADLIITVDLPTAEACKAILLDTLDRIAKVFPKVGKLRTDSQIEKAAVASVGLDGRRIRKAVLAALAHTKQIAMNPDTLTAEAVLASIKQAQAERANMKGKP